MPDTITITDDRTGKTVTVPITGGVFPSSALRELDPSLFMYDPAYLSTAACRSDITYLDGDAGILRYRGYPIEQLAEHSTYLEVAYLLLHGELPDKSQLEQWTYDVTHHTFIHENMRKRFVDGFHYDAHPMGMFVSSLAALGTFYPESKDIHDPEIRDKQILRLLAKSPTLAAMCYRFSVGLPFFLPDNSLSYPANFLTMMWKIGEYELHPALERAMDVLFILHADHEQNCGTTAMRVVGSSHADPYSAAAAAASALYGPLHGGANEQVVRMLTEIGSIDNVPAFVEDVKAGKGRLMGFGHRVYKNYDPRAKIIKQTADEVFEVTGKNPLLDIALKLEETALSDPYFIDRKLYPNVDFYSGLIYQAMGFPVEMFTVLFAIPRMSGWLAHWDELLEDKDQKISRPAPVVHRRRRARLRHPRRPLSLDSPRASRFDGPTRKESSTISLASRHSARVYVSCSPSGRRGTAVHSREERNNGGTSCANVTAWRVALAVGRRAAAAGCHDAPGSLPRQRAPADDRAARQRAERRTAEPAGGPKRRELRQEALTQVLNGEARPEQRGASTVVKVGETRRDGRRKRAKSASGTRTSTSS